MCIRRTSRVFTRLHASSRVCVRRTSRIFTCVYPAYFTRVHGSSRVFTMCVWRTSRHRRDIWREARCILGMLFHVLNENLVFRIGFAGQIMYLFIFQPRQRRQPPARKGAPRGAASRPEVEGSRIIRAFRIAILAFSTA